MNENLRCKVALIRKNCESENRCQDLFSRFRDNPVKSPDSNFLTLRKYLYTFIHYLFHFFTFQI